MSLDDFQVFSIRFRCNLDLKLMFNHLRERSRHQKISKSAIEKFDLHLHLDLRIQMHSVRGARRTQLYFVHPAPQALFQAVLYLVFVVQDRDPIERFIQIHNLHPNRVKLEHHPIIIERRYILPF